MLKSRIVGMNPCNVDKIFREIKQFGYHARQAGGICSVEMACWDLAGKAWGVPCWQGSSGQEGDVYVADCFGKIIDGTLIGDNLGNAIYSRSKTGVIFDAGLRDLEGLEEIEGFNAYVRGWDPSYLQETTLMGINVPVRIGNATVLPGDVVLAKREGAIFIPPHLLEEVVITAEFIMLRDTFGHQRLREGKYTPGQIDGSRSPEIKQDFLDWTNT